jgi:hypothetical protein
MTPTKEPRSERRDCRRSSVWRKLVIFLVVGASTLASLYVGSFMAAGLFFPGGCDERMVQDRSVSNGRGEIAGEYLEACTGFGTVVNYSVVLRPHGDARTITLVCYDEASYAYPKLRWLDDDALVVELGKVNFAWSKRKSVGSIRISYVYTTASWGELWREAIEPLTR